MARILILEDKIDVVDALKGMLEDKGHEVGAEMDPARVLDAIKTFQPDVITLDVSFSEQKDETGIDLLQEIRREYSKSRLPVIVVSGTVNADKLTRLMAHEANGYIGKPVKQADLLKKVNDVLEAKLVSAYEPGCWEQRMIGESPAILELILEINKAAQAQSDLLITGESGAGKEQVVAKYRELSPRRQQPFVVIDCTTIPETTFESEIFGHEKGAFTGAGERKRGKIEGAARGMVFFDEIGDLPGPQQQKLLRLLQTKTFTRMGSNDPIRMDIVILAATRRNLFERMKQGKFREDLYYRLKYMNIEMPPLREHAEDIPNLVEYFIRKSNHARGKKITGVEEGLVQRFKEMPWRGNVRELEKCVEFGVITCEGQKLGWPDVMGFFKAEEGGVVPETAGDDSLEMPYVAFKEFLDRDRAAKEKRYYLFHLQKNYYNVQKTAQELGVARPYLMAIMKRLGIEKPGKA